jgi:hypothetical protein
VTNQGWGVVRRAAGTGLLPADDCCAFDGWYADRMEAETIYANWCKAYPACIVALVQGHDVRLRYPGLR